MEAHGYVVDVAGVRYGHAGFVVLARFQSAAGCTRSRSPLDVIHHHGYSRIVTARESVHCVRMHFRLIADLC